MVKLININLLQDVLRICSSKSQVFSLEDDYYWKIPESNAFDIYNEPTEFMVGSLFDDIDSLEKKIAAGDAEINSVDISRIAALLNYISFKISSG